MDSTKHFYIINTYSPISFSEVSEDVWIATVGTSEVRKYVRKILYNKLSLTDVPAELQSAVQMALTNKIARLGDPENKQISSIELQNMIEEVL